MRIQNLEGAVVGIISSTHAAPAVVHLLAACAAALVLVEEFLERKVGLQVRLTIAHGLSPVFDKRTFFPGHSHLTLYVLSASARQLSDPLPRSFPTSHSFD